MTEWDFRIKMHHVAKCVQIQMLDLRHCVSIFFACDCLLSAAFLWFNSLEGGAQVTDRWPSK